MSEQEYSSPGGGANKKIGLGLLLGAAVVLATTIGYRSLESGGSDQALLAEDAGPPSIERLVAQAEASEDDASPWQLLGFAYFQRGEFEEATSAYERAVEIAPDEAVLWSALGESRVMASQRDPMPAQALAAFNRANELDSSDPRTRYFLSVQRDLDGDHQGAIDGWLALLADTPPGSPWEEDLVRTIEQVGAINSIEVADRIAMSRAVGGRTNAAVSTTRGPTAEQIVAAGTMTPSEQREMAEGMVERLEARLESEPSDLDGWVMLMRSRMTLEQPQRAQAALQSAIAANPEFEARLRQEAARLGVR